MTCENPNHAPSEIQRECRKAASTRPGLGAGAILLTCTLLALLLTPCRSASAREVAVGRDLILNGSFATGSGDQPTRWEKNYWNSSRGTAFEWRRGDRGLGVVVVRNPELNDARWVQNVAVEPNQWYRLSGFIRAVGVGEQGLGASLSLMTGFDHSRSLKGTTPWTPVSMWFKTTNQRVVKIACRLGGFGQTSSGEAWCTGIKLESLSRPPLNTAHVYGPIEERSTPVGLPTAVGLVLLMALVLGHHGRVRGSPPGSEKLLLAGVLLVLLAAKAAVAPYFQYNVDVGTYSAWAMRLAAEGPARFYAPNYFADYPPGYMYVLWGIGVIAKTLGLAPGSAPFLILLKLPALLADAAIAWLLYARLREGGKKLAWVAAMAFALNPALVLNSAVWGQTDSVLALLVLLAILAQGERNFELSWILGALAVLTKPQALLLVPLLAFWPRGWWKTGRPISSLLAAGAVVFAVANPFRGDRPWSWLTDLYFGTTGYYAETSVNAMNLAALLFGMRHNDAEITLGLSANTWGFVIGLTVGLAFLVPYLWQRSRLLYVNLFAAGTLVSFTCLTRMHERYLYPFFVFAALIGVTGPIGALYWILSALFLTNELVVYLYQQSATAGPDWLWRSVAALNTACMFAWLAATWRIAQRRLHAPGWEVFAKDDEKWLQSLSADPPTDATPAPARTRTDAPLPWLPLEILFLLALSALALVLRLYRIDQPGELVFDEIYFVEQARNYLNGTDFLDPHPPFAKLMIGLGIFTAGDTALGWRIMNALVGGVLVALMYVLARDLFLRRIAAGATAIFVALDGLCIVDSRIGVIDIHYVTWAVGAYILAVRLIRRGRFQDTARLLGIGAVLGISVGAKLYIPFFSFLLVMGSLAVTGWQEASRLGTPRIRFLCRPILVVGWTAFGVYFLTYTPHYLWGWWTSPIDWINYIFVEVPGYQSAVAEATHPYSSKWYTWPLLLRPVWYFWQDPGPNPGEVVGIWGSGNLAVWWASVPALLLAAWRAFKDRDGALAFVVAGWVIHLAPWVGIGRTLFLYHYLPSLLFAFLALAWMLDRLWHGEGSKVERGLIGTALVAAVLPVAASMTDSMAWAPFVAALLLVTYFVLMYSQRVHAVALGRATVAFYGASILLTSWWFLPIWLGIPLPRAEWDELMSVKNLVIFKWI